MKNRFKSMVWSSVFAISLMVTLVPVSYAQADPSGLLVQNVLQQIRAKLEDFSKQFKLYYDIKLQGRSFRRPIISADELKKIKEPAATLVKNQKSSNATAQILTLISLKNMLFTRDINCPTGMSKCQTRSTVMNDMRKLPLKMPYTAEGFVTKQSYQEALKELNQSPEINAALSLNGLLKPLAYTKPEPSQTGQSPVEKKGSSIETALNFVKFVSEQAVPLRIKPGLSLDVNKVSENKDKANEYVAKLRSFASQESVGMSNFYWMIARRDKGKDAKGNDQKQSPLEMEHEMATRRLKGDWHDRIGEASPLAVQRETLYLLAEMNYQLYQMRMQQERLLATNSAMQLLFLQAFVKQQLSQQAGFGQFKKPATRPTPLQQ